VAEGQIGDERDAERRDQLRDQLLRAPSLGTRSSRQLENRRGAMPGEPGKPPAPRSCWSMRSIRYGRSPRS
jgi:hypothetical protein